MDVPSAEGPEHTMDISLGREHDAWEQEVVNAVAEAPRWKGDPAPLSTTSSLGPALSSRSRTTRAAEEDPVCARPVPPPSRSSALVHDQLRLAAEKLQVRARKLETLLTRAATAARQTAQKIDRRELELKLEMESLARQEKASVLDWQK